MRLKSYFAQSIGEAIESARLELGPEAMLLNSRKTAPEQNYLGQFEVVFGITGDAAPEKRSSAVAERAAVGKQLGPRRIFPDLVAPEPAASVLPTIETPIQVSTTSVGAKRIFPDLVTASLRSISEKSETSLAAEVDEPEIVVEEPVYLEPAGTDFAAVETAAPTRPLFPKATVPAATTIVEPAIEAPAPQPQPAAADIAVTASAKQPEIMATEDLAHELAELRKQLQAVSQSLAEGLAARAIAPRSSVEDLLLSRLLAFDFSEDFSKELIGSAAQSKMSEFASMLRAGNNNANANSMPSAKSILAQLKSRFAVDPDVGKPGASRRVVMFVGPPGAGKTTSIVKLAVQLGLEQELPIHLLSLDTFRVAGAEQLNAFGRILGVGFTALHTPEALAEALEEHRDKKLVLIDTPGYAAADEEEMEQTAAFFRNHPEVEIQLVLPATARTSSLRKFVRQFSAFQPSKLIYTRLDEVDTFGPVVENTIATGLPISFLADGQSIPQDLHEATKDRLTEGLFATARAAAISAA